MHWYYQNLLYDCYLSIDIINIWFRIIICPSVIFFPDIFALITLIHKQIIAVAGYYACDAFIVYGKLTLATQYVSICKNVRRSIHHTFVWSISLKLLKVI